MLHPSVCYQRFKTVKPGFRNDLSTRIGIMTVRRPITHAQTQTEEFFPSCAWAGLCLRQMRTCCCQHKHECFTVSRRYGTENKATVNFAHSCVLMLVLMASSLPLCLCFCLCFCCSNNQAKYSLNCYLNPWITHWALALVKGNREPHEAKKKSFDLGGNRTHVVGSIPTEVKRFFLCLVWFPVSLY